MKRNTLVLFIDESGIHKSAEHSSFVFVYVHVDDREFVQHEIIGIEKSLRIEYFHWSNYSTKYGWGIRKKFMEKALKLPFTFKYRVIENPIKPVEELHRSLLQLLDQDSVEEIYIDGSQPKWFGRNLKRSLRDRGFSIRSIRTVDDVDEPIIRLADALANVIRIYHDNSSPVIVELFRLIMKKNRH